MCDYLDKNKIRSYFNRAVYQNVITNQWSVDIYICIVFIGVIQVYTQFLLI